MTEEQAKALDSMIEWRDALHERILKDDLRESGQITLWFALIAIRNVMNGVATSFGLPSFVQESSLTPSVG